MALFKKESLEILRQRVDLVEVISGHVSLHKSGASYKGLCPFHEEKTPSFIIQKGDSHYHCYGCAAHGDAIAFLMSIQKLTFSDAVQALAERFGVVLEQEENQTAQKGPPKKELREVLEKACRFYHFALLYSVEGKEALKYLYTRGLDLEFLTRFQIGYAPEDGTLLISVLRAQDISEEIMQAVGLMTARRQDFFSERITFPIRDGMGNVIGFSARKFREETYGGKYINTSETTLFKKSHVLFGLNYSRQKIARERRAIIVEGQLDALRLIHAGFDYTVAGQGTAFGEWHVKELLQLGVDHVFLALDGDRAGLDAAIKIGDLFQKKGIEVGVLSFPEGSDPDSLLREGGGAAFVEFLEKAVDYLTFLFRQLSQGVDLRSPPRKAQIVEQIAEKIRSWESAVLIHESLRKLAKLAEVPEEIVGMEKTAVTATSRREKFSFTNIQSDQILETDLLRWLLLMGGKEPKLIHLAHLNLAEENFQIPTCRQLYIHILQAAEEGKKFDMFCLGASLEDPEEQKLLSEILQKKINFQKAEQGMIDAIDRLLLRSWMEKKEMIKSRIQSGQCTDEEALALAKEFDVLQKQFPQVKIQP